MSIEIRPDLYDIQSPLDKISNGDKAAVDWAALSDNQDAMIDPRYLPPSFIFRDPSKMKKAHYLALLEHWYERQQDNTINTVFTFKGYWDPSTESVITADDEPANRKRQKVPIRKRNTAGRTAPESKRKKKPSRRAGPPGIRRSDAGWFEDGDDDDGCDNSYDEEEDGNSDEGETGASKSRSNARSVVQLPSLQNGS